jgi:hypothetical protein
MITDSLPQLTRSQLLKLASDQLIKRADEAGVVTYLAENADCDTPTFEPRAQLFFQDRPSWRTFKVLSRLEDTLRERISAAGSNFQTSRRFAKAWEGSGSTISCFYPGAKDRLERFIVTQRKTEAVAAKLAAETDLKRRVPFVIGIDTRYNLPVTWYDDGKNVVLSDYIR